METKELEIGKNKFSGIVKNSKYIEPEKICKSWGNNIKEKVANNNSEIGLRKAQFGALCSIRSHWTVSNIPATIVISSISSIALVKTLPIAPLHPLTTTFIILSPLLF